MKDSPLTDLSGVKKSRSTGTCFLGAFKRPPGENGLAVMKSVCSVTPVTFLTIFSEYLLISAALIADFQNKA